MISVRLNEEIFRKISALMKIKDTTRTKIIKNAINEYYDRHDGDLNPFKLGSGLFGKYGAGESLSEGYKDILKGKIREKHTH